MWDMRFDPSPKQIKQGLNRMQQMMDRIIQRPEVGEESKEAIRKALEQLKQPGLTYREILSIQTKAFEAIGFGGRRFGGRFGPGRDATTAEPGTYAVKLTVNKKSYTGKISVRQDPMLEVKKN
jgi:hypothetical protein